MATNTVRTLDEVVSEEKLEVLVASDNSVFNKVAPSVLPADTYKTHLMTKREIARLLERNGHLNPDVILFNMGSERYDLGEQLNFLRALGLKYPDAKLIVTLDDDANSRLFGSRNRDEAYLAIWRTVEAERDSATLHRQLQFPIGTDARAAEEAMAEGLSNVVNSYLGPDVVKGIHTARQERTTLKLFATDLDGSLLNKHGHASYTDIGAMKRLSQDMALAFASGRAPISMEETTKLIQPASDWYLTAHNGAIILRGDRSGRAGDVLYERPVEIQDAIALLERFGQLSASEQFRGNALINYFSGNHGNNLVSVRDELVADLRAKYVARNGGNLKYNTLLPNIADLVTYAMSSDGPHKILIIVRPESGVLPAFRKEICDITDSSDTLSFSPSQPHYFEFTHMDATKANTLRFIIKSMGIRPQNVAYVGNSMNDVGAWNLVGYPIAVRNADSEVYDAMDRATAQRLIKVKDNNHDGVAHAIQVLTTKGAYRPSR